MSKLLQPERYVTWLCLGLWLRARVNEWLHTHVVGLYTLCSLALAQ
jgi:hypothetical protein